MELTRAFADVDAAVQAAHAAWPKWAALTGPQRGAYLRKAADILRAHDQELALVDALNTGNPVAEMKMDASCTLPLLVQV